MQSVPGRAAFVGRQAECDRLTAGLNDAIAGQPQIVLLEGDAGIGKTRLAREAESQAESLGMQTIFGRFIEDGQTPFLPFASAFLHQCERARLLEPDSPLGPLAAHLRRVAGLPAGPAESESVAGLPLVIGRAVLLLAQRRPLLFVVDDLHWAERGSVDLFAHLVQAVADAAEREPVRVCILALLRPPTPDSHLDRALERLRREPAVSDLVLHGLDELEVNELIAAQEGASCAPPLLGALQRATHGNPLFVLELLAHLEDAGALTREHGHVASTIAPEVLPLPRAVTRSVAGRVSALPDRLRDPLTAAALSGDEFTAQQLAMVTGLSEPEAIERADEATGARLFVDTGDGYRFAHPIIRRVFQERVSSSRRKLLHGEIASRLRAAGDGDDFRLMEVAGHLDLAGDRSAFAGATFARAGAVAFDRLSWGQAGRLRDLALSCTEYMDALNELDQARLVLGAAIAHHRDMDPAAALPSFEAAERRFAALRDREGWSLAVDGLVRSRMVHTGFVTGTPLDLSSIDAFCAAFPEDSPELGQVLATRAEAMYREQDPRASVAASRALAVGAAAGALSVQARATFSLGLAREFELDMSGAAQAFAESAGLAAQAEDPWLRGWGLKNLPIPLLNLGDALGSSAHAESALEYVRSWTGDWAAEAQLLSWQVPLRLLQGNTGDVERLAAMARRTILRASYPWAEPPLYGALALSRAYRNVKDAAVDAAEDLRRVAGGRYGWPLLKLVDAMLGDHEGVRNEVEADLTRLTGWLPLTNTNLPLVALRAELAVACQSAALAARSIEPLEEVAARGIVAAGNPGLLVSRVLGDLFLLIDDRAQAERWYGQALQTAAHRGLRGEAGRAHLGLSLALRSRSERADHWHEAESALREIGWRGFARTLRAAAAGLDVAIDERSWLLPFEDDLDRDIVSAFASGRSPKAAADELLVSEKTVLARLEAARTKLGLRTPSEAAGFLARGERVGRAETGDLPPGGRPERLAILFTDLVGSTEKNQEVGDDAYFQLIQRYNAEAARIVAESTGQVVKLLGDGVMAVFPEAKLAVRAGLRLSAATELPARVGIHFGDVRVAEASGRADYIGLGVTQAARACAAAEAGEVLATAAAREAVDDSEAVFTHRGWFALKGLRERVRLLSVTSATGV